MSTALTCALASALGFLWLRSGVSAETFSVFFVANEDKIFKYKTYLSMDLIWHAICFAWCQHVFFQWASIPM